MPHDEEVIALALVEEAFSRLVAEHGNNIISVGLQQLGSCDKQALGVCDLKNAVRRRPHAVPVIAFLFPQGVRQFGWLA